ncbi:MAG: glycosyltransferase [Chitinophagales bacterium]|nr:glycosyltransferase [Chitinophagales bacterium]
MVLFIITILLFCCYSALLLYYYKAWKKVPDYQPAAPARTLLSVIIPARNEEANIGRLLTALTQQRYPQSLTEIIVVDDHSTDQTAMIVRRFPDVKLVQLKEDAINSYKKKAIEKGIAAATGELIITTDADCIPGPDWLNQLASFREEKKAVFIAAPVVFTHDQSLLQVFQALDFLVLQGITAASVHAGAHAMCNGANMAYDKKVFQEVNGFAGIDTIASGDDMLLMHKIARKYPSQVQYLKSDAAIVQTAPMTTWKDFLNQRIRWASKAAYYEDKRIFAVLLLVYLFNLWFVILAIASFFSLQYGYWLLAIWIGKTIVEYPFVYSVARFYKKTPLTRWFFLFQPLHIVYTILSGLLGQLGSYEWKGRKVK